MKAFYLVIYYACAALIGFTLGSAGIPLDSWHFWVIMSAYIIGATSRLGN
jgi:hypothetical protein